MIKVCGMREPENIRTIESLGIDWMGFIFWPRSSRNVADKPSYLPKRCKRVGVFVDEKIEIVVNKAKDYALDIVQLHGSESTDYITTLRSSLNHSSYMKETSIMKALPIATPDDLKLTKDYALLVDFFLFDTKTPSRGGSGQQFDWSVLDDYDGKRPFLLSGGIGPDDTDRVKEFMASHSKCIGIDLNSRFEISPGLKDYEKLKSFIEVIR